jgi:HAD superfamily hydrolase (TIGR01549 family)
MTTPEFKAVLFDLDDTLLCSDMDVFLPHYLQLLSSYTKPLLQSERFVPALLTSTRAMIEDRDPSRTNREVFWESFSALTGIGHAEGEAFFARFYRGQFQELSHLAERVPHAVDVVQRCIERGLKVVIATNPVFPQAAIDERLRWAGFESTSPFALVTSYENMRSTKPNPEYYREILAKISCAPNEALMVGNDEAQDITPARAVGLQTLWVQNASQVYGSSARKRDVPARATLQQVLPLIGVR